jgi:hypothetical protein
MMSRFTSVFVAATAVTAFGCASRSAPATLPTKPFDAAASDAKAIQIVDQMVAAMGGEQAWAKAHEIQWHQAIIVDGELKDAVDHSWDRWNGRHQFIRIDRAGSSSEVMHDLFEPGNGTALIFDPTGKSMNAMKGDKEKMVQEAQKRWAEDSYRLTMAFKLKDPGVHIKWTSERPDDSSGMIAPDAPKIWDEIQVKFDPGVGPTPDDTYYVLINKTTHLIDRVEHVPAGKKDDDRDGFKWDKYVTVGGLKFAVVREELGSIKPDSKVVKAQMPPAWKDQMDDPNLAVSSPGGYVVYQDVAVHESPDEDLYVPAVVDAPGQ